MNVIKHKIVITGGSGRFGTAIKKNLNQKKYSFQRKLI